MTRDEIVTALRYCAEGIGCGTCPRQDVPEAIEDCGDGLMIAAADLIENQQRHIEALMKANDSLKDAIARRDKQIEKMKEEKHGMTKYTAELRKRLIDLRDELETAYDSISQLDGANGSLMAANEKLAAERKALINELCQYCGKYKQTHEGACDGCRWREK